MNDKPANPQVIAFYKRYFARLGIVFPPPEVKENNDE